MRAFFVLFRYLAIFEAVVKKSCQQLSMDEQ